jgi:hypothetical protein
MGILASRALYLGTGIRMKSLLVRRPTMAQRMLPGDQQRLQGDQQGKQWPLLVTKGVFIDLRIAPNTILPCVDSLVMPLRTGLDPSHVIFLPSWNTCNT